MIEVLLFSDNIEALAAEDIFPDTIHRLCATLGSNEDVDALEIWDASDKLFEYDFANKAGTASHQDGLVFIELCNHSYLNISNNVIQ